jgi:hypothetical protein
LRAILGDEAGRLAGLLSFATPAIASFIRVSWDLTVDPRMSTITGSWVWHNGGSYFLFKPNNVRTSAKEDTPAASIGHGRNGTNHCIPAARCIWRR